MIGRDYVGRLAGRELLLTGVGASGEVVLIYVSNVEFLSKAEGPANSLTTILHRQGRGVRGCSSTGVLAPKQCRAIVHLPRPLTS